MPHDRHRGSRIDYAGPVPSREARRRRCSLKSSIPLPVRPVRSASTAANRSTVRQVRFRPGVEPVCPSHRDARHAGSRGEKSGTLVSSRRYGAATCDTRGRIPSVPQIRASAFTRRSAPVVCVRSASRSSRAWIVRFSVASASTRETAANGHPRGGVILRTQDLGLAWHSL
jgi:hypothetical protein